MKRISMYRKLLVLAGCAALVGVVDVSAGFAASATATTTAVVITPIGITKVLDLNFGKFAPTATSGTVVVSTGDVQTVTGGVDTTAALGASAQAAKFTITGEPLATYAITYPTTTTLIKSGGDPMTIGTFTTAVSGGGSVGTLPNSGPQTLMVGATLTVGAAQASGTYTGSLEVAVNYN